MSNHPIFLDIDTLTSQILPTPSPPADNPKRPMPKNFNPQLSMIPKPLRPYWSHSCRR